MARPGLSIFDRKSELEGWVDQWTKTADSISQRRAAWDRLRELHQHATGLPEAAEIATSVAAIEAQRALLNDPDPVPALTQKLTNALRGALTAVQTTITETFAERAAQLNASDAWKKLTPAQRDDLARVHQLTAPAVAPLATDEEILSAVRASSLAARRDFCDAVPARFIRALDEAARLLEPKAVRVTLPAATLKTEPELDAWLARARTVVAKKLRDGPVIL